MSPHPRRVLGECSPRFRLFRSGFVAARAGRTLPLSLSRSHRGPVSPHGGESAPHLGDVSSLWSALPPGADGGRRPPCHPPWSSSRRPRSPPRPAPRSGPALRGCRPRSRSPARRTAMMSARLPVSRLPTRWSQPRARAPSSVAMRRTAVSERPPGAASAALAGWTRRAPRGRARRAHRKCGPHLGEHVQALRSSPGCRCPVPR